MSQPSDPGVISTAPRRLKIIATGVAVPGTVLVHDELDRRLGLEQGSTFKATQIRSRFISTTETAASLAADACRATLANSGLAWEDIDCLVAASGTMDQALPYNAAMIHAELGLAGQRRTTFDICASCMSFLTAMDVCGSLLETGRFRRIMIVSADISTFTTDPANLRENGIFGDGAAACIIEKAEDGDASAIIGSVSVTLSEGVDLCAIPAGGSRFHRRVPGSNADAVFQMKPRPLFAIVAAELPKTLSRLLDQTGTAMDDISLVVPHQASYLAVRHIIKILQIDPAKVVNISETHANQVGASLPTALHHGLCQHQPRRGEKILLLGAGAGVSIGAMILTY